MKQLSLEEFERFHATLAELEELYWARTMTREDYVRLWKQGEAVVGADAEEMEAFYPLAMDPDWIPKGDD